MPVTRFRKKWFRYDPVQRQLDLKNNLVFQQLEKEQNGEEELVKSYHPLQPLSFFADVCTRIPRPKRIGFDISPYNDLVPKMITIRIDGKKDSVSNIVDTFQRERFLSYYVGESIESKGSWSLYAQRYSGRRNKQDLLEKIIEKYCFSLKEAHRFVKENTLVGFWSECPLENVMKFEDKLIEELNPVCNTKGKKKNKVTKMKKKKEKNTTEENTAKDNATEENTAKENTTEENTAKGKKKIRKRQRAMIYSFTSIERGSEDELEKKWSFDKVNPVGGPKRITYIDWSST